MPSSRLDIGYTGRQDRTAQTHIDNLTRALTWCRNPASLSRLLGELRVRRDTPTAPPRKANPVFAQHTPYIRGSHIAESLSQKRTVPSGIPRRRRIIKLGKDAPFHRIPILYRLARTRLIRKTRHPSGSKSPAPLRDCLNGNAQLLGYGPRRLPIRRAQNDLRPQHIAVLSRTCSTPRLQKLAIIIAQHNTNSLPWHDKIIP
jgi:hypothetical protein